MPAYRIGMFPFKWDSHCAFLIPLDNLVLFKLKQGVSEAQVEQFINESKEEGRKVPGKAMSWNNQDLSGGYLINWFLQESYL